MYATSTDNPWMASVAGARRRWPGWAAALAAAAFSATVLLAFKTFGGAIMDDLAATFRHLPEVWGDVLAFGTLQITIFGLFLIAALAATSLEGRSVWGRRTGRLAALAGGLAIGAGGYLACVAIAAAAGAITPSTAPIGPTGPLLVGFALVLIQSVAEETFFRGWLQPLLCSSWGAPAGLLTASALFAALHVIAGAHGALAVGNLLLGGVLFGLLALRTGNLFAAAGAHFAWNWTESGALGLSEDPTGSILHLGFTGSPLWNGGEDAMNGSLAMTIVLIALVTIVALSRRVLVRPA